MRPRHIGSQTRLSSRLDELLEFAGTPRACFRGFTADDGLARGVMFHPPPMDKDGKNDVIIVTTNQFGTDHAVRGYTS